jgi:hypothetical protein
MPLRQRHYSKTELAHRGDEVYAKTIQPKIETDHKGEFVVIDVETGEFEVDASEIAASDRLLSRLPEAQVWLKRVGFPYVRRFGPQRRALPA